MGCCVSHGGQEGSVGVLYISAIRAKQELGER